MRQDTEFEQRAPRRFLRLPEVIKRTGLGGSTIYRRVSKKTFPAQYSLGDNSVAWLESDIEQWIDCCISGEKWRPQN